jgi:hypothetical protein
MCRTQRDSDILSPFAISKSCAAPKSKDGTGPDCAVVVSLNVAKFVIFFPGLLEFLSVCPSLASSNYGNRKIKLNFSTNINNNNVK